MKLFKFNLLSIFLLLSFNQLIAQNYNFRNFSIKEGLPDAIVTSTVQTTDGFLYFTTQNGLSKFDGKKVVNFTKINGLADNNIEFALEYKPNKLLLATFGGLSLFDGDKFTNFTTKDGLINDSLFTLFKYGNQFLLGTRSGISIFSNGTISNNLKFDFFKKKKVFAFEYDKNKTLFIGTNKGFYKFDGDIITTIDSNITIFDFDYSSDGILWCATNRGVYNYKNNSFKKDINLKSNIVYSIKVDYKNQVWCGTLNGIFKKSNNNYTVYANTNFFLGRECYNIFQDREYNLWFATNHGAYLFDGGKFVLYDRRYGVSSTVWSLIERDNGDILCGTDGNGVLKLDGDKFYDIPELSKLSKTIWALFEDQKKNLWFCTSSGVSRLDSNNLLVHFSSKNGFTDEMILSVVEDDNNNLWFSSYDSKIYKYDGKSFTQLLLNNASSTPIYLGTKAFDGCLWFISGSGIDRIKDGKSIINPAKIYRY